MNDDILKMAREAECEETWGADAFRFTEAELERFADLVRADEREACARVCEGKDEADARFRYDYRRGVLDCVDAIRARSKA